MSNNVKLYLAPMEGVVDWTMRRLLTRIGGIDQCVTEFLRVTDLVYPTHIFYKNCPELHTQSKTESGTPVFLQLLGGQAEPMALNAIRAVELGACGIDINFGCPAKTVNRHDGGAAILKSCHRVFDITQAVRNAVPKHIPVTVKIRLGYDNPESCIENSLAIQQAGANRLTVHCRTKTNGYTPPAYWEWIPRIKEQVSIPIVANGEIWNIDDFKKCLKETECEHFMIGRGALANPFIFKQIKNFSDQNNWKNLIPDFYDMSSDYRGPRFAMIRTKQWMRSIAFKDDEALNIFNQIKTIEIPELFRSKIQDLNQI